MDLKKAKKVSHILMLCLSALNVFVLGGTIILGISSILIWILPAMAENINPYYTDIQVQGMELLVGNELFSIPTISASALLGAVKMLALSLAIICCLRIFKRIKAEESPFQHIIAKDIRWAGIFLMIYQIIWSWEDGFLQIALALIIPLILFCVASIFEYGCILQKEIDETL